MKMLSKKSLFSFIAMAVAFIVVIALAIRPYTANFYTKMYGIDVGGWVMYRYDLVPEYHLSLVSKNNVSLDLNAHKYIWHGTFGNSPHPHYNEDAMRKFIELLSQKKSIQKMIQENNAQKIIFSMKLTKNKEYWKTIVVEKEVKLNDSFN